MDIQIVQSQTSTVLNYSESSRICCRYAKKFFLCTFPLFPILYLFHLLFLLSLFSASSSLSSSSFSFLSSYSFVCLFLFPLFTSYLSSYSFVCLYLFPLFTSFWKKRNSQRKVALKFPKSTYTK